MVTSTMRVDPARPVCLFRHLSLQCFMTQAQPGPRVSAERTMQRCKLTVCLPSRTCEHRSCGSSLLLILLTAWVNMTSIPMTNVEKAGPWAQSKTLRPGPAEYEQSVLFSVLLAIDSISFNHNIYGIDVP
ncbi:hypothetical protein P152DRAFT_259250 [Eremomyces bilateralis CBS 781.70]|uniref:Uncharacterized protein n=1 Tax=Eremomyces bilateralis CBS 781.70 TaxID=1392243 RepID=A0A6G1FQ98_9PEZI|nr:uncharacterized protein P152DRAFT_259250 [Eremomyces bilateralis CBS 781.70]KAF1808005.1 hypothetical protein P152DRAFT_259250 [Eremomyces bilateralis CBS 781.70]